MNYSKLIVFAAVLGCMLIGCHDILNQQELGAVNEELVWNDLPLADAYVNNIYEDNLPGWDRGASDLSEESDEGFDYMYGQLTIDDVDYWPYEEIRTINVLLANIDEGTLAEADKNRLKGEALFFRAWRYFEMAIRYGGVPLILEPAELEDDLLVERASTSAVFDQIIADLDQAIAYLPTISATSGDNDGHVHKGTAMALKGRVLLYWASEQFDPDQTATGRWQAAYDANKAAKDYLVDQGFGLYPDFENFWFDEMNRGVIFVHRYEYPVHTNDWNAGTRPLDEAQGSAGSNQPTWEIVQAFPMKDGKAIDDPTSAYTYDEDYYWQNRDPRFGATIAYNGTLWELSGKEGRIQWTYIGGETNAPTETGFYCRKAINESYSPGLADNSATDWVEIRFAEVMMNLAEAANEIGLTSEAEAELVAIRARAGIDPGTLNLYGLEPAMIQDEMRNAIMLERKIEFAFEAKRYRDLRRRRLYEDVLNGTRRHGMDSRLIIPEEEWSALRNSLTSQQMLDTLSTNYTDFFEDEIIVLDTQSEIDWQENYYFYAIPQEHLRLNSNLQQTEGWPGGTFDVPGNPSP